jgi:hypothetical protein
MKDKSCILLEMSLFNTNLSIQIIVFVHNFVVIRILILREYFATGGQLLIVSSIHVPAN